MNIQAEIWKKRKFFGRKPSVIYSNLLDRNCFKALKPDEKYVTDFTHIQLGNSFYYLSVILDLYNNEVLAWSISKRMTQNSYLVHLIN
ncbi:DDE-type integrase/transposase/recombinase [Mesobacillus foraminis]|uniref:DDE-type integrase/transposase/recombinase n=1 Tax=Mesobacillus foraminis TaxID=279826 RepID=UPI00359C67B1